MNLIAAASGIGFDVLLSLGVTAVLLLLVFFMSLYRREQQLADYEIKIDLEGKSPKWIEKKAQELVRVEAFRLAGDLRAHLKQWEEAAELYQKGGNFLRAAESFLEIKKTGEAALMFMSSEDYHRAANLFIEHRDFTRAADAFIKAGDPMKAAMTYVRGEKYEEAAKIYLEHERFRRASEVYAKRELWSRAADSLWRSFGEEQARLPEDVAHRASMPLRLLARQAGDLFKKSDRMEEAIEAYRKGSWVREAAATLESLSRFAEAGEAYLEDGDLITAADCFKSAGELVKAAGLRARHHLEHGREREAVHFLEEAGEHARAAEIYKKLENWIKAGDNFEKARMYREAAPMFEAAEEFDRAGDCMDKAGEYKAAADLYGRAGNLSARAEALEKVGDFLAAGGNYFERGLFDKAIALLQKVDEASPEHSSASLMLGQIFREKGMLDLALEYFNRAIKDQSMSRTNLESYYQLAVCEERRGAVADAAKIFENILVVDFHFKDVADRLSSIKSAATQIETASAMATPSGTGDAETVAAPPRPGIGPAPGPEPTAPASDNRYAMIEEIGRGGMGIVYKARDTILDREVAFKVLPANLKEHPQALKNFFREARSAAKLNDPYIVTVYDAGEVDGTYYIAMEYIEGETLKEILNRQGKLPVKAVLMIAGQVCKALEYAHGRKIVHRDVKSSNIMWTKTKQVKLMDFGLAKVIEEVKGYQTVASGTPYYMSPEQALGRNIDHRTDVYSLGVTIFEMVTGKLPFMQGDAAYHHVHTPPPHAKSIDASVPDAIDDVVIKCMQKKPEDRFGNASELFKALKDAMPG